MSVIINVPNLGDVPMTPCWTHAGAPTNGTSGTLAGFAEKGDMLVDSTNAVLYQNTNTQTSPTWTAVGTVSVPATSAAITSGTIDGTAIGGSTPAAGSFTTMSATGASTLAAVTTTALHVDTGTKTATASSGAATLNKMAGVVTSESLTTAAGATYTLTLTNSDIAAADQVLVSVGNGSNSAGTPAVASVTPGAGSVVVVVQNIHASAALNGTIKIAFVVAKN